MYDDEVEIYSESLRNRESRELVSELSKSYTRLKMLNDEERVSPEGSEEREKILDDEALLQRKIGALEEEIGRRKKNNAWPW